MPWSKVKGHSDCPDDKPWAVVKDDDGEVEGCHSSESDADDQIAALYASEDEDEDMGGKPNNGTKKDKRLKDNKTKATVGDMAKVINGEVKSKILKDHEKILKDEIKDENPFNLETLADDIAEAEVVDMTAGWHGILVVEGVETGDGREFKEESLTWRDLPVPLRWNKEDSHGGMPHTVAVNVGRIDEIWREGLQIHGRGVIDLSHEDGKRVHHMLENEYLRGVSIDADSIKDADIEIVWSEVDMAGDDDVVMEVPEKIIFHKGRISAATLVDIPAFAEAIIELNTGSIVADGKIENPANEIRAYLDEVALVAALGVEQEGPPADWFEDPQLSILTGITITDEGRIYGHAAEWGTCHIGFADTCKEPPREDFHSHFMTGELICASGNRVAVGQITAGTGHASLTKSAKAAAEHYDNTGSAVADVSVGNDEHGIWVAGAIRPDADPKRVRDLMAAGRVSGDWRRIGGQLRLVGLLAVNIAGFQIPQVSARVASGAQQALVAAGQPKINNPISAIDKRAMKAMADSIARRVGLE